MLKIRETGGRLYGNPLYYLLCKFKTVLKSKVLKIKVAKLDTKLHYRAIGT